MTNKATYWALGILWILCAGSSEFFIPMFIVIGTIVWMVWMIASSFEWEDPYE